MLVIFSAGKSLALGGMGYFKPVGLLLALALAVFVHN